MKTEYMNEFLILAKTLNFTKASEELFIAQPVLSRHISSIEAELGVDLLERSTHSVHLTPNGKSAVKEFQKIMDQYNNMCKKFQNRSNDMAGEIRLGVLYYSFESVIDPVIRKFKSLYPNIEIKISSYQPTALKDDLLSDDIDIAVAYSYYVKDGQPLLFRPIFKEKYVVMHEASHPFSKMEKISLSDLQEQPFVFSRGGAEEGNYIQQINLLKDNNIQPGEQYGVDNVDLLFMKVRETNGVALLPHHMSHVKAKHIAYTPLDDDSAGCALGVLYKSDNRNPAIPLFIKSFKQTFS